MPTLKVKLDELLKSFKVKNAKTCALEDVTDNIREELYKNVKQELENEKKILEDFINGLANFGTWKQLKDNLEEQTKTKGSIDKLEDIENIADEYDRIGRNVEKLIKENFEKRRNWLWIKKWAGIICLGIGPASRWVRAKYHGSKTPSSDYDTWVALKDKHEQTKLTESYKIGVSLVAKPSDNEKDKVKDQRKENVKGKSAQGKETNSTKMNKAEEEAIPLKYESIDEYVEAINKYIDANAELGPHRIDLESMAERVDSIVSLEAEVAEKIQSVLTVVMGHDTEKSQEGVLYNDTKPVAYEKGFTTEKEAELATKISKISELEDFNSSEDDDLSEDSLEDRFDRTNTGKDIDKIDYALAFEQLVNFSEDNSGQFPIVFTDTSAIKNFLCADEITEVLISNFSKAIDGVNQNFRYAKYSELFDALSSPAARAKFIEVAKEKKQEYIDDLGYEDDIDEYDDEDIYDKEEPLNELEEYIHNLNHVANELHISRIALDSIILECENAEEFRFNIKVKIEIALEQIKDKLKSLEKEPIVSKDYAKLLYLVDDEMFIKYGGEYFDISEFGDVADPLEKPKSPIRNKEFIDGFFRVIKMDSSYITNFLYSKDKKDFFNILNMKCTNGIVHITTELSKLRKEISDENPWEEIIEYDFNGEFFKKITDDNGKIRTELAMVDAFDINEVLKKIKSGEVALKLPDSILEELWQDLLAMEKEGLIEKRVITSEANTPKPTLPKPTSLKPAGAKKASIESSNQSVMKLLKGPSTKSAKLIEPIKDLPDLIKKLNDISKQNKVEISSIDLEKMTKEYDSFDGFKKAMHKEISEQISFLQKTDDGSEELSQIKSCIGESADKSSILDDYQSTYNQSWKLIRAEINKNLKETRIIPAGNLVNLWVFDYIKNLSNEYGIREHLITQKTFEAASGKFESGDFSKFVREMESAFTKKEGSAKVAFVNVLIQTKLKCGEFASGSREEDTLRAMMMENPPEACHDRQTFQRVISTLFDCDYSKLSQMSMPVSPTKRI